MPPLSKKTIALSVAEIARVLCPRCREKLKQLIAEKVAERVMEK
jgi:uncharacterized protein with PIN domain